MFKSIIAGLVLFGSAQAFAAASLGVAIFDSLRPSMARQISSRGLPWKVGDEADYAMSVSIFRGTMISKVNSIDADGIWISQDINLGSAGQQSVKSLLDPVTGETKRLIVNGKEEPVGKSNYEVIEAVQDTVKVPAGTFACIRAKLQDKETNATVQMWVNQAQIPLSGMIQEIEPSQFGDITIRLIRFKKN